MIIPLGLQKNLANVFVEQKVKAEMKKKKH